MQLQVLKRLPSKNLTKGNADMKTFQQSPKKSSMKADIQKNNYQDVICK